MSEIESFSDYTKTYLDENKCRFSEKISRCFEWLFSLWKKIKKKDEKTGEEIEVEDYDWDKITKAVKSFVEDYNDVVKEAGESNTKIKQLNDINWIEIGYKEGDTFSVYGKEYAIDSSGHINVSAEDEFTSTEIKYPSRSI